MLPLAGVLTVAFAFRAGGFFPDSVAAGAAGVALLALLRLTVAARPFAGWSGLAGVVALAGAALASWTLLSALWSDSAGRAIPEFDRTLLYVLTFCVLASVPRGPGDLTALLRWVLLAIVVVAAVAVATRLFPAVFPVDPGRSGARLSYPVTYWNALSVLGALGIVLGLHAASGEQEPLPVRVLAGAALPVLALAAYFPFSRGGIAVALIGVVFYAVLARPRRLVLTLLTAGPPVAIAVWAAYGAQALAEESYAGAAGQAEGRRVAWILAACVIGAAVARLATARLERRLDGRRAPPLRRRTVAIATVLLVAVAGAAVAVDAPERVRDQYQAFVEGDSVVESGDSRDRLTQIANNGRLDIWRVALDAFEANPVVGTGAGTFRLQWELLRPRGANQAVDGHSLALETLAELGLVGGGLLLVLLGGLLIGPARNLRAVDRHAHAAVLAGGVALLAHAGIDWDWEMPVLFAWLFAAGGLACARTARRAAAAGSPALGRVPRVLAGLACLLLAVMPVLMVRSQWALERGQEAFAQGDCPAAVDAALDSVQALPARAAPYELLGYCDLRLGALPLAVQAMEAARERDPDAWQHAYGLAVARAIAREGDPRPPAAEAVRLNPSEPLARDLRDAFERATRERWPRVAGRAGLPTS